MAKPIEATPMLNGRDAQDFLQETFRTRHSAEKEAENDEARKIFKKHKVNG